MAERIACPNPRFPFPNDVRPVTTVVESGKVIGSSSYSGGQTELSQLLAPPAKPTYAESDLLCGPLVVIGIVLLIVAISCAATIPSGSAVVTGVYIVTMVAIFIVVARRNETNVSKSRAAYEAELPKWEHAMSRWRAAYFCPRCRSVFVPDESGFTNADNLQSLLYR